jgi:hypothetical protein
MEKRLNIILLIAVACALIGIGYFGYESTQTSDTATTTVEAL